MLEFALILVRLTQFGGAMILLGSSLFFIYALPISGPASATSLPWPKRLLVWGAVAVFFGSLTGLVVQTTVMAGSFEEALKPDALHAVTMGMGLGRAGLVRAGAAALTLVALLVAPPGRGLWSVVALLGAVVCASLVWMGHGAATEGPAGTVHLVADIVHVIAAAVWIGALAAFLILLLPRDEGSPEAHRALYGALHGFSGLGSILVAVLVGTGLVNSWFLVGPERLGGLWTTPYGQLLVTKMVVFAGMLMLAATNRFHLTPRLGVALDENGPPTLALAKLRKSLIVETTAALGVLSLVAVLGTLVPVRAT